jgi:hypothetical protein
MLYSETSVVGDFKSGKMNYCIQHSDIYGQTLGFVGALLLHHLICYESITICHLFE